MEEQKVLHTHKKASKITVFYEDGTTMTVKRGFLAELTAEVPQNKTKVKFYFAGVQGEEIVTMVLAVVNFAYKFGIIGPKKKGSSSPSS